MQHRLTVRRPWAAACVAVVAITTVTATAAAPPAAAATTTTTAGTSITVGTSTTTPGTATGTTTSRPASTTGTSTTGTSTTGTSTTGTTATGTSTAPTTSTSTCSSSSTSTTTTAGYAPGQVVYGADFEDGSIPAWLGTSAGATVSTRAAASGAYGLEVSSAAGEAVLAFPGGARAGTYSVRLAVRAADGEPARNLVLTRSYKTVHFSPDVVVSYTMEVDDGAWQQFGLTYVTVTIVYDVAPCQNPYLPAPSSFALLPEVTTCSGAAVPASTLFVDDLAVTYVSSSTAGPTGPTQPPSGGCTPPTTPPTTTTTSARPACPVAYDITSSWPGGFLASVTLTNPTSSALTDWWLGWDFVAGETLYGSWNGGLEQNGSWTVARPPTWAGPLPPGGSWTFGLVAAGSSPQVPSYFYGFDETAGAEFCRPG